MRFSDFAKGYINGTLAWKGINSSQIPAVLYLVKVNNRSTRTTCEISPKLTIRTL